MADNKEEKKGGSKKLIIIIGIIVALVVVAGGVYFLTIKSVKNKQVAQQQPQQLAFCDLGSMLVNLNNNNPSRYLQAQIALAYDAKNKNLAEELKQDTPLLKDITIYYLKNQKAEQFATSDQSKLKDGLLKEINKQLFKGQVKDVCFEQLTIQ